MNLATNIPLIFLLTRNLFWSVVSCHTEHLVTPDFGLFGDLENAAV